MFNAKVINIDQRPQVTPELSLPLILTGRNGKPLFEFAEGLGGAVLRFLRSDGEPFLEMGADLDGRAHVSIFNGEHAIASLSQIDDGGSCFLRGADPDGAFVDLCVSGGEAVVNVGETETRFRDLAA